MGNVIGQDVGKCSTMAKARPSRMVLVTGHVRSSGAASPAESESPGSPDKGGGSSGAGGERTLKVWVEAKQGATVGWVMSRVMEELATKEPDVPNIVGLRVVRRGGHHRGGATPSRSPLRGSPSACPFAAEGDEDEDLELETVGGGLLVDLGQQVLGLLAEGDCLECIFEVDMPPIPSRSREEERVRIGDFQVVRMLGTGASCRVVQVRKRENGKFYAVKVMSKRKVVQNTKRLERAIAEKRVLARLSHPFIVSLHWAFQTRGHLFMVLDYCAGGELFHHLQRRGRFAEADTRFYVCEILLALEYLHTEGIVYRDLKPENCLLDGQGHVRLTDFGLSGEVSAEEVKSVLFQSFVGTVLYLSPEMIRREGHGFALDFYCLGCLLYVMLTGSLPHFSGDLQKMCEKRAAGAAFSPPRHCSQEANHLCQRLLDPTPSTRMGSKGQAMEAKEHAWFKGVNWVKVYRKEKQSAFPNFPPVNPLDDPEHCFSSEFTRMPVASKLDDFGTATGDANEQTIAGFSNVDNYH